MGHTSPDFEDANFHPNEHGDTLIPVEISLDPKIDELMDVGVPGPI